ncbi:hypothetical protein ACLOJK_013921 [Asimina triloba]
MGTFSLSSIFGFEKMLKGATDAKEKGIASLASQFVAMEGSKSGKRSEQGSKEVDVALGDIWASMGRWLRQMWDPGGWDLDMNVSRPVKEQLIELAPPLPAMNTAHFLWRQIEGDAARKSFFGYLNPINRAEKEAN